MTTKRVLRYMIECEHGIDNYVNDEPTVYEHPLADYAPAGKFVTVRFYDDDGARMTPSFGRGISRPPEHGNHLLVRNPTPVATL